MSTAAYAEPYAKYYLPGVIQAEDYDTGGQGVGYGTASASNAGGAYREDDVDIYTDRSGAVYCLLNSGEWTKYTFSVKRTGAYSVGVNLMLPSGSAAFAVYFDNKLMFEKVDFSSKVSPQTFDFYKFPNVYLKEGEHSVTIQCKGKKAGVDYIKFSNSNEKGYTVPDTADAILPVPEARSDIEFPDINFSGAKEEESAPAADMAEFYVSPDGNDSGDGSEKSPFGSIERAAAEVRKINRDMTGDITVHLSSGRYELESPIKLTKADGGTNGYRVVYQGASDLSSVISGGKEIKGFKQTAGKPFWELDLKLDDYLYEFYVNDHRANVARSEYKYQAKSIYDDPATTEQRDGFVFAKEDMPLSFDDCAGMMMSNSFEWVYNLIPVAGYKETTAGKIFTGKQPYSSWYSECLKIEFPVYFLNHISLLDKPGEFYYDKKAKKLYYYPLYGEDINTAVGYYPVSDGLVDIMGEFDDLVTNLTFDNITYKHGQWKRTWEKGFAVDQAGNYIDTPENYSWVTKWQNIMPAQFQVSYADGLEILNSRFENLSAGAIGFLDKVYNSTIDGNTFFDIGASCVDIGRGTHMEPMMNDSKNICKNITVSNNFIRSIGQVYQSSPAITAYYVNNCTITHNDIKDVPYTGVSLGWGWGNDEELCRGNAISYNKIDNVMHSMWDGSHIYTLGNLHGSSVEGNYLKRTDADAGGGTYYPDEGSKEVFCRNNVFENPRVNKFNWDYKTVKFSNNFVTVIGPKTRTAEADQEQLSGFTVVPDNNWPAAAKKIINNAGLSSKYRHLEDEFKARNLPDVTVYTNLPRFVDKGVYIALAPGRDFITEGGEGVAFHDATDFNAFDGYGRVDYGGRYWSIGYNSDSDPEWLQYHLKTDVTADYNIYIEGAAATDSSCDLFLDGKQIVSGGVVKGSGNWGVATHNRVGEVHLEKDKDYILKFAFKTGAFNFSGIDFAFKDRVGMTADANYANLTEADVALPPVEAVENIPKAVTKEFNDIKGHWAADDIKKAAETGFIDGYENGSFLPNEGVTKAEALKMLTRAANLSAAVYKGGFDDVSEDNWFAPYVAGALAAGIIEPSGKFEPNHILNREETAYLMIKVLKILPSGTPKFTDYGQISERYLEYVAKAQSLGLIQGDDNQGFNPKNTVTRAEISVMLLRIREATS